MNGVSEKNDYDDDDPFPLMINWLIYIAHISIYQIDLMNDANQWVGEKLEKKSWIIKHENEWAFWSVDFFFVDKLIHHLTNDRWVDICKLKVVGDNSCASYVYFCFFLAFC